MFKNIGGKIKGLARIIFIIEAILATISSFIFLFDEDTILIGILLLIGGTLIAWVSTWILFGFGELIEKTTEIANNTKSVDSITIPLADDSPAQESIKDNPVAESQPISGICQLCSNESSHLTYCKIKDNLGTRYRNICDECIAKHNAVPTKK